MSLARCAGVLWTLTFLTHPLGGQEKVLKDAYGDPLPPGAIGRLGQMAFRVAAPAVAMRYVDGGSKLLVKTSDPAYRMDGVFQLFDAQSGNELNRFSSLANAELPAMDWEVLPYDGPPEWCLSWDGKWLARVDPVATKSTAKVRWQEVATGKVVATIEIPHCFLHCPQFSPDGKYIAMIAARELYHYKDAPAVIRMWNVATHEEVRTFAPPEQLAETFWPRRFAFSPDGAFLAASGWGDGKNGVVRLWEVAGEKPCWALDGQKYERESPTPFAFSPDSKVVAVLHDGKLGLWDAATGHLVKAIADYDVSCARLDFSPDGSRLLTYGSKQIQMWHCRTGKQIDLPKDTEDFIFSRAGDVLLAFGRENKHHGSILICDGATAKPKHSIGVEDAYYDRDLGWPFALSPDGKTLVLSTEAGQIQRFSVATGKVLPPLGYASDVAEALAYSPDGKKLLAAGKTRLLLHAVDGSKPPLPLLVNPAEIVTARDFHRASTWASAFGQMPTVSPWLRTADTLPPAGQAAW
jgi:WD40 repeat protein